MKAEEGSNWIPFKDKNRNFRKRGWRF